MKKIIFLEFNELSPQLLDKWMGEGKLPNFKKLYDNSKVCISKPDVVDDVFLEPWIQWYSMHVGKGYDEHKVFHLTDGSQKNDLDIWTHLKENGKKVASFASMNTKAFKGEGHVYLPDPWCFTEAAFPSELDIYQSFITENVQEHTNKEKEKSIGDHARFIIFMLRNGLELKTIYRIIKQLFIEKIIDKSSYWKRVVLLDRIQMDLFKNFYKKNNFDFATFFINSTAHLQHAYWRYMEPEAFGTKPTEEEIAQYGKAILLGYQCMDSIVGEMLELTDDNSMIILASALSQKPYLKKEETGGQHFYRPHDVNIMLQALDIRPVEVQATMTHQYMLRFKNKIGADLAKQRLLSWSYGDNEPVFGVNERVDDNCIYFGNQISEDIGPDMIINDHYNNKEVKHSKFFYRISEVKSGCHHPDGVFWIETGKHQVVKEKISILDAFPTISDILDVPVPQELIGKGQNLMI